MYIFENIENKYKLLLSSINKELLLLNNSDENIEIDNNILNSLKNDIDTYNINNLEIELTRQRSSWEKVESVFIYFNC